MSSNYQRAVSHLDKARRELALARAALDSMIDKERASAQYWALSHLASDFEQREGRAMATRRER